MEKLFSPERFSIYVHPPREFNCNRLKLIYLFVLILLLPFSSFSIPQFITASTIKTPNTINWKFQASLNGVDFYQAMIECKGQKVVLLKFVNKNSYKVKVEWNEVFTTKQIREKTEGFSGKKEIILSTGETSASDCNDSKNKKLIIHPIDVSPAYAAEITAFEFKSINVSRI